MGDTTEIDTVLTAQLVVAWAGEGGEQPRLNWWRSDLCSEFGGEDLFRRLLPSTWVWATFQCAREAARRHDAALRSHDHNPDRMLSLFSFGFEDDERLEDRLQELKRSGRTPQQALPDLAEVTATWDRDRFLSWVKNHGDPQATAAPVGRHIKSGPPEGLAARARLLVGALAPLADSYPLPHFRHKP